MPGDRSADFSQSLVNVMRATASSIGCTDDTCVGAQCCYTPAKCDGGYSCTAGKELRATASGIDCTDGACDDAQRCYTRAKCDGGHMCTAGKELKATTSSIDCTDGACDDAPCGYTPAKGLSAQMSSRFSARPCCVEGSGRVSSQMSSASVLRRRHLMRCVPELQPVAPRGFTPLIRDPKSEP